MNQLFLKKKVAFRVTERVVKLCRNPYAKAAKQLVYLVSQTGLLRMAEQIIDWHIDTNSVIIAVI